MAESLPPNFLVHLLPIRNHLHKHSKLLPALAKIFAEVGVIAKRCDERIGFAISIMMVTAKPTVLDVPNHAGPQLIAVHVALTNDFVLVLIDHRAAIAGLKKMPFSFGEFVEFKSKAPIDVVQEFGEIVRTFRLKHHVTMIAHPLIAGELHTWVFTQIIFHPLLPEFVMDDPLKTKIAVIHLQSHMDDAAVAKIIETLESWHESSQ